VPFVVDKYFRVNPDPLSLINHPDANLFPLLSSLLFLLRSSLPRASGQVSLPNPPLESQAPWHTNNTVSPWPAPCPSAGLYGLYDPIFVLRGFTLLNRVPSGKFNRVKMNVADQFLQIVIFLAYDGFVSIVEKLTMTPVSSVIKYRITREQPSHQTGNSPGAGSK
jgi:hypothetical protein